MSSNGTSTSSSEDGLGAGVIWVITFFSTCLIFGSIMTFVCCDAYKKYYRRVPREYITGRGNYPRQPSAPTQGTTVSNDGEQSKESTSPQTGKQAEEEDTQTGSSGQSNRGHVIQVSNSVDMPSTSKKKSTLPPIDSEIPTISGSVPEGGGAVNGGFTDKPLPSIKDKSSEIVLTPVTNLNLGVSIYS
ncbi:uncharacterized protein LOC133185968 [Saccostrea echinata]|uniref:uncharacterized protein LOC133185968 n=1 Tax=Saccostrea echinata TaxID=191078 RepID=UPI002A8112DF|nr:uncharacterized protein LOC133185968 [Saccostrea echinata]